LRFFSKMGAPGLLKVSIWAPLWRPWASEGRLRRLRAPPGAAVACNCAPTHFFTKKRPPGHLQMEVGGGCVAPCESEVKQHFSLSGVVFMWGKQHSSKTAFLQALANVTKVTFAFFKEEVHTKLYTNLCKRGPPEVEPDTP